MWPQGVNAFDLERGARADAATTAAAAAKHEGGDPGVVGSEVVGKGATPPGPEERHGVERDHDVHRVVVARGEDEETLRCAEQHADPTQDERPARRRAPDGLAIP